MRWLVWLTMTVTLTGCAVAPPSEPERAASEQVWRQRQVQLAAINHWVVRGRVGIDNGVEAWQANMEWQQAHDAYLILLTGPLGQGSLRLTGNDGGVILSTGEGQVVRARDAEELLRHQTGMTLPLANLLYWVRGLPTPGTEVELTLDEQGRVEHMADTGWEIDFDAYTEVDGLSLPRRMSLARQDLEVRMVVSEWRALASR
jgi:outer membrane lipoprotein LolB